MLEARLSQAQTLKRLLDAIKELVTDANFECNEEGLKLQAMDNSHVALVSVSLKSDGFKTYRCDRPMPLGVNLGSLTKVLKCAKDDDEVTLKANDNADVLHLVYEAKNSDRIAEYEMKLMDIDTDTLGIPDTDYDAQISMSSSEFQRICRDLSQLGESVRIEVTKEGVRFAAEGESANGNVMLRTSEKASKRAAKAAAAKAAGEGSSKDKVKKEEDEDDKAQVKKDKDEMDEDEDEIQEVKKEKKDKKKGSDDEESGEEEAGSDEEEDEEGESSRKRKRPSTTKSKPSKKAKKDTAGDEADDGVAILMNQHVNLTFSLKYLVNFSKSATLCNQVHLKMSNEVPLLVEYKFEQGVIQYYLAPKIGDD